MAATATQEKANEQGSGKSDPMAAARKAKKERKTYSHVLTGPEKFGLRQLQLARSGCKLLDQLCREGKGISSAVVEAAAVLAGAASAAMDSE